MNDDGTNSLCALNHRSAVRCRYSVGMDWHLYSELHNLEQHEVTWLCAQDRTIASVYQVIQALRRLRLLVAFCALTSLLLAQCCLLWYHPQQFPHIDEDDDDHTDRRGKQTIEDILIDGVKGRAAIVNRMHQHHPMSSPQ